MKHLILFLSTFFIFCQMGMAQSNKYVPTKFDTIKKVVPQQVYGRQKSKLVQDPKKTQEDATLKAEQQAKLKAEEEARKVALEAQRNEEIKAQQDEERKRIAEQNKKTKTTTKAPKTEKPISTKKNQEPLKPLIEINPIPRNYSTPGGSSYGATTKWTLQQCIEYARDNNLQITAQELNERLAKLMVEQSKASRLPNVNGTANLAETYGRSIDPTSNQFVTKGFLYNTLGVQSQALVFGWFQKKYQIEQNKLDLEATNAAYNQLKDDISLNVATGFLRILLAREQVKVSEGQLKLDLEQHNQTVKFVNAGKLPELNLAQMEAQLANDSATLVANKSEERIALLQLRALLNFNFEQAFDIQSPNVDISELTALYDMPNPEEIFNTSIKNQYRMKVNQLKLLSAQKSLAIAKTAQYPQLTAFGNLGTNFSTNVIDITGQTYLGEAPLGNINIGGTSYPLTRPEYRYSTATRPIFTQYGNNIQANIGLGVSVPIFNAYTAKTNVQKAKIGLISQQITMDNDQQKLKQDIYTAYEQAKASSQKYMASKRSQDAAQRALDFAVKRYGVGMINTYEYTSILNSLYTVSSNVLAAKYDLMFKLKVLDYYMGNPLKL